MNIQNVYECLNLDFEATYENLCKVFYGVDKTEKGHISFRITPKKIAVLISPKGKVQVAWENEQEKQRFLPLLERYLIGENGKKPILKPLKCNVVNVPFPPPEKFSFAWCKKKFRFIRQKPEILPIAFLLLLAFFGFGTLQQISYFVGLNQTGIQFQKFLNSATISFLFLILAFSFLLSIPIAFRIKEIKEGF